MEKVIRTAFYDEALDIEAFRFEGIMQPFENHFHEDYVIGLAEGGKRRLSCKNREYDLYPGNVVLFQPGENHACVQSDGGTFDYRGLIIPKGGNAGRHSKSDGQTVKLRICRKRDSG